MKKSEIAQWRLHQQNLLASSWQHPEEVVEMLGAIQSQDFAGALWGLGLRLPGSQQAAILKAFNAGKILRTHVLRPTWHFVAPADIRWMLMLTAPRVNAINQHYYRQAELDEKLLRRTHQVIEKTLRGGHECTRLELRTKLTAAGLPINHNLQMTHVMMHAELTRLVCSGAQRGKQQTYALLEERVPPVPAISRDEALAKMIWCYFLLRGPATIHDFAWWSGLTVTDAKRGVAIVQDKLASLEIEQQEYWFVASEPVLPTKKVVAHLLPNFDEYFIGYKDRSAISQRLPQSEIDKNLPAFGGHILIINGQIVGTWKAVLKKETVTIHENIVTPLTKTERSAVADAIRSYSEFLELKTEQPTA